MASNFDQYWKAISDSESFQDLPDDQKEKVRNHLFETQIQSHDSYLNLPQSQRISVKKHFDDATKIAPETMMEGIAKKGKKLKKAIEPALPALEAGAMGGAGAVARTIATAAEAPAKLIPMEKVAEGGKAIVSGIEKADTATTVPPLVSLTKGIEEGGKKIGEAIEPTEEEIAKHTEEEVLGKPGYNSDFDKARLFASGAVKTASQFIAQGIPTSAVQLGGYLLMDGVLKYAGTTFLGREIGLKGWKPKTGMGVPKGTSGGTIADAFEQAITKENMEQDWRSGYGGPPKPLEHLVNSEEQLKVQGQLADYEEWLKKSDVLSQQGGEPKGDIYPEAKVNVSQLRDAAKARLEALKNEPVRVESVSEAEDALRGYYRLKTALIPRSGEAIELPASAVPRETPGMLPAGPQPAGLLPAPPKTSVPPTGATPTTGTDVSGGLKGYKDYLAQSFRKLIPQETKQTINKLSGAMLKALQDNQIINARNPKPLDPEMMTLLDRIVDQSVKEKAIEGIPPQAELAAKREMDNKLRAESGFPTIDHTDNQQRDIADIAWDVYKGMGEKGGIGGPESIDPVQKAKLDENVRELVERARALGYKTTQDVMLFAARNAPDEVKNAFRKNLAKTLSPFDTNAYQEMNQAEKGNPVAKKSLMDSAMRDYLKEKMENLKGYRKARSVSKIIGQFHDGDEAKMRLMNDLFIHDHLRKLDTHEAAALRWYIEGKAPKLEALKQFLPESEASQMLERYKNPTDAMKKAAEAIRPKEDEWHDLMSEFYDSMGYAENYVTRRWKQPREYMNWEGRTLNDKVPFVKGRKLLTHADGIDAGYEPKSFDIRDDIKAANDVRVRLLTRLHDLRKIASSFDSEGRPSIIMEESGGQSSKANITSHSGKAPDSWLRYQNVPLLRGMAINPDYKPALDYIMGARYKGLPIEVYEHLGSLSKASILGYSLFHPASLTEMLLGGVSYRDVFTFNMEKNVFGKILKNFAKAATADLEKPVDWKNPKEAIGNLYKSFLSGHAALANRPLALDMAEHGFKLGAVDDVQYNILSKTMSKYENWLKIRAEQAPRAKAGAYYKEAQQMVAGIREAGDLLQKVMWDYQRPLFSMALYENHLADNIKAFNLEAPEGKKMPIDQIKFQTNNFISKMVGGISMGTLLATPRAQQFLQWAMMAPDWTIGRALMPAAALSSGPEGRQSRKLMLRMGTSYFVFGNLLNYHNTQKNLGKGRFMWENDPGHEMEIAWRKDNKGRTTYIQVSKAFTEIYDDIMHPAKTLAYKANPLIHAGVKLMQWATSGSYPSTMPTPGLLQTTKDLFVPRTFSGMNAYGTFPIHKGISRAQVMGMFDKYYTTGNEKFLDQAVRYGMESGFDVHALERAAKARHSGQIRRKEREDLFR